MSQPVLYPILVYERFDLMRIGRCLFRISDGTFTVDETPGKPVIHAEEPFVSFTMWQMVLLLYPGTVVVKDIRSEFMPGTVLVLPPATPLILRFQADSLHLSCHFRLLGAREDKVRAYVPQLTALEPTHELNRFREVLDFAYEVQHVNHQRAATFVWELFFGLVHKARSETGVSQSDHVHPTIRKATAWFDRHLADPIRVSDVAASCGITRRHLLRLFRQELGTSPSRFIRARRARRAHLLLTQTDRPIKLIADDVGIRDLAHFSRIIREEYGASPRQIRRGG
jgi:AraC-like DNA-binding protein